MTKRIAPAEPSEKTHPQDIYTQELHTQNLELVRNSLDVFGGLVEEEVATPWLKSPSGLVRTQEKEFHYEVQVVETRDDGFFGLPRHFVKHTIKLDEQGIHEKSNTKLYMRVRQHLGVILMNRPISAGMMLGYPSIWLNPQYTSKVLVEHLGNAEALTPATRRMLSGLYISRSQVLKHWVGVKLPKQ